MSETNISRSALVEHSAQQMFDLVNDVHSYPNFLPWCTATRVMSETADELVAEVEAAKGMIKQCFTTRNTMIAPECIEMNLVEGPFESLHGVWGFHALGDTGCKVTLDLSFKAASGLVGMAFGAVFNEAANRLVDAFCQRANDIYG